MDSFSLIQHFFASMHCNFCANPFEPEGIELIREEEGFYLVSVSCAHCERQIGVAMVGVEATGMDATREPVAAGLPGMVEHDPRYKDPELTEAELERFSGCEPINYDDVLSAHRFFTALDDGWMRFIPPEILERCTDSETE